MFTSRSLTAAAGAAVAFLAGIAAALGVFARGDGTFVAVTSVRGETYEMATNGIYTYGSRQLVAEGVGWDVFTLVVAVPVLIAATWLAARGSFRGLLALGGMLGYFAYLELEYAVTWPFGPLFPVFIVAAALSVAGLVGVGVTLASTDLKGRFDERFPRRAWAGLSIGMAVLLTVLWAARIVEGLAADVPVLHGETTMTVQALDLIGVVPAAVIVAVGALRRHPAGMAAATAFAVTFITMCAAIAAMMVSAAFITGELALPPIIVFGLASVLGLAILVRMFRSAQSRAPAGVGAPSDRPLTAPAT